MIIGTDSEGQRLHAAGLKSWFRPVTAEKSLPCRPRTRARAKKYSSGTNHCARILSRGLVHSRRYRTIPRDRILAQWFVPELYFFAQRGFAAGMVATFGGHWSEPRFQARSVQALASESVPIVIKRFGEQTIVDVYILIAHAMHRKALQSGRSDRLPEPER